MSQSYVLAACQDSKIRVYDVPTAKCIRSMAGTQGDGTLIKVLTFYNLVNLYNMLILSLVFNYILFKSKPNLLLILEKELIDSDFYTYSHVIEYLYIKQ